jgi:hypothetical protein
MTPLDWASLSLRGSELPPPTVGGSPLVSGGHVTPFSGDGFARDCASAELATTEAINAAMIGMAKRNAGPRGFRATAVNAQGWLNVPKTSPSEHRLGDCKALSLLEAWRDYLQFETNERRCSGRLLEQSAARVQIAAEKAWPVAAIQKL